MISRDFLKTFTGASDLIFVVISCWKQNYVMINPSYSVRMRESLKTINLHAFYHLFFRGYQKIYYSILIDKPESKLHVPIQSQSASLGTDTKYNDVTN